MSKKLTIVLFVLIMGCSEYPKERPQNFGFIFEYGPFPGKTLNTFDGTFTNKVAIHDDSIATVIIHLTSKQLDSIYTSMIEINIFDYPAEYVPEEQDEIVFPSSSYSIKIISGKTEKVINWSSGLLSKKKDAVKLRDLFDSIINMIQVDPKYSTLPKMVYM